MNKKKKNIEDTIEKTKQNALQFFHPKSPTMPPTVKVQRLTALKFSTTLDVFRSNTVSMGGFVMHVRQVGEVRGEWGNDSDDSLVAPS